MSESVPQDTNIQQKQCTKCKQYKLATTEFFYHRKNRKKNPISSWCRLCHVEYQREKEGTLQPAPDGQKRCRICKICKPATVEFFEKGGGRNLYGIVSTCRECQEKVASESRQSAHDSLRQCSVCKEWKPATVDFFSRRKARKSGFQSSCRDCCIKYKNAHAEERAQYAKIYSQTHKDERRRYSKQWHVENRERISRNASQYHIKNRERINRRKQQYYKSHREQYRLRSISRIARQKAAPGTLTLQQIRQKLRMQRFRCYYCAAKLERQGKKYIYHLEHTIPLSRVEHNPRHDVNYVVLSCPTCNLRKKNKLPHEWPDGGRLL